MAVCRAGRTSGEAAKFAQSARERAAKPPQSPRGFSALAHLYYLARPTKTAMLRRLNFWHRADDFKARHSQFSTCKRIGPTCNVAPVLKILGVPRLPSGGSLGKGKRGTVPKIWLAVPIFLARVKWGFYGLASLRKFDYCHFGWRSKLPALRVSAFGRAIWFNSWLMFS